MSQQEFWNSKFSRDGFLYGLKPNTFLASKIKLLKRESKLLCLGEGEGRNAIFFAKRGFKVTALDASDIGLAKLEQRAKEENLDIKTLCLDLNHWESDKKYDVIVASYLHMYKDERVKLFEKIEESLNQDAYFIGEFFSTKQLNFNSGGPKDEDLLYTVDDFKKNFLYCDKEISEQEVILDEGRGHQGDACVIRVVMQKL
ncbi:SAM-dependent methyltransferase [Poseidonibacter ostreae]|jgi:cyclopropane fatty-acyl-phospholipid synthase-like methyltransferase|uniref:Methyltransferase domain-containing protein n=1 Tax=Poseidonibacter ostreae TaxID=2654171 RepID=A0A6L4WVN1_9BACT|nr:methyltransferase domain-containing protein [Poseidonibacter ostreae]KAB7887634.1 methyltransferase domain-containing protein [Poseidonibacter ostreae]KAB7890655.1 methyltransferase domain-containing protein [Poseidonibacter ostreae]KAB7892362.1 methyltransferase domain-containing protein [Poseidonibacter ostreae]MAC83288.1 tellurium resistance protein [Arcobacter sp.]|tara:strand:- start:4940 stop:5539 length:600 start_codon:yes stop_codon:yes gene_type:complete